MVESKKMSFFKEISKYAKQICASCLLFIAFFLFACRMIIVGASLLDMEIRIGQDFATTSRLVTSHSAGYFVGAIIGKILNEFLFAIQINLRFLLLVSLQDRHLNDFLTMGIGTSVAGAAIMVIPFLYNFYAMVFASFLNGLGNSVFDLSKFSANDVMTRGIEKKFPLEMLTFFSALSHHRGSYCIDKFMGS